ncbi:hypothetical protein HXA31_02590 [Salipaludibacillus agaradhaerens]|uniref:Uncharacterized protein n=1 Tax=Salipaludibacillus agaradhaerens TaxID=76935 RepID=A0A9Q4FZC2_SALAG|nr:hypothetical protein [Salipaludibacillus agaradhaerens]MCR6097261.1 hypothetical protein [Salipaludibacillus agaradhaerens]MCR6113254.1 hypothetical protein [Salipaludibacillus agaradhaerens]
MATKKVKIGIIITSVIILSIAGLIGYSLLTSAEAKLANAIKELFNEDTVHIESEFDISLTSDASSEDWYLYGDEEMIFDLVTDLFDDISGTGTLVLDNENHVLELTSDLNLTSDLHGEDILFTMPFHLYIDEIEDEMAIDLDPYVAFMPEMIDTFSYQIIPNVPMVQEELYLFGNNEEMGDFFSAEFNPLFMPIFEEYFEETQLTQNVTLEESFFHSDETTQQLNEFMIGHTLDYISEHHDTGFITVEDDWLYTDLEFDLLIEAELATLEAVKEDVDMTAIYEDVTEQSVTEGIEQLENAVDEDITGTISAGFLLEDGLIIENSLTFSFEFEEEGIHYNLEASFSNVFTYNQDPEFTFYNEERHSVSEDIFSDLGLDLEQAFDDYIASIAALLYGDQEEEAALDENSEVNDGQLTEDDLWLISLIEERLITHEDAGMDAESFYLFVVDLEDHGLVKNGTSDYYIPE